MVDTESPTSRVRPDTPTPIVELRNVSKSFGPFHVLQGLDLTVFEGETLVIIGRSGTGKSVTIRHIVGLLQPDAGEVQVFGENPWKLTAKQRKEMRLRVGYLFQSGALLNWMTIEENVELPLLEHRRHLGPEERSKKVLEKLRAVELESARKKFPSEISGGMKKRAALARASVLDPDIILYDEPTSGLDPVIANTINDLIVDTQKVTGATQVVVTHDMESAYRVADRISMLYEGKLILVAPVEEFKLTDNPIVTQFIHGRTEGPMTKDG